MKLNWTLICKLNIPQFKRIPQLTQYKMILHTRCPPPLTTSQSSDFRNYNLSLIYCVPDNWQYQKQIPSAVHMEVLIWMYSITHHYQYLSVNLDHPQGNLYVKWKVTSGQLYSLHAYTRGVNHILILAFSKNGWHLLPVLLIIWYTVNYMYT